MLGLFLDSLWNEPHQFVYVVVTVVFSVTLHELAHGYLALRLGDPTPKQSGHWTWNPMVHMGGPSFDSGRLGLAVSYGTKAKVIWSPTLVRAVIVDHPSGTSTHMCGPSLKEAKPSFSACLALKLKPLVTVIGRPP